MCRTARSYLAYLPNFCSVSNALQMCFQTTMWTDSGITFSSSTHLHKNQTTTTRKIVSTSSYSVDGASQEAPDPTNRKLGHKLAVFGTAGAPRTDHHRSHHPRGTVRPPHKMVLVSLSLNLSSSATWGTRFTPRRLWRRAFSLAPPLRGAGAGASIRRALEQQVALDATARWEAQARAARVCLQERTA